MAIGSRPGRIVIARDAADVLLIHSFGQHELVRFQAWTYEVEEGSAEMREREKVREG